MTFLQAIVYFVREASSNLFRSWKISLLAISTISLSLFLAGVFLLVSGNLGQVISGWQDESKIVVYLKPQTEQAEKERLEDYLKQTPWIQHVEAVSSQTSRERFEQAFPSLSDLLEGWGDNPLPATFELALDRQSEPDGQSFAAWLDRLREDPVVSMIDDDRDWLKQLEAVVFALKALGTILGGLLLATAIFTISSVIRLTAYLYRDEIAVMRLVGATEFFIRGPFYMEGLLQGLAGGAGAVIALAAGHSFLIARHSEATLSLLAAKFLTPLELISLVALGGLTGAVGAIASLRRETLGQTAETPEWAEEE